MHLLDELGHPLLQFLDTFFITRFCWIDKTGTKGLEALVLWLFDCIVNCFSGIWLMKIGQQFVIVVDVGIFETDIPFDLQLKLELPFFFPVHGNRGGFVATAAQKYIISCYRNATGIM